MCCEQEAAWSKWDLWEGKIASFVEHLHAGYCTKYYGRDYLIETIRHRGHSILH